MLAFATVLVYLAALAFAALTPRQIAVTDLQSSYDYIVVGCGISGLVVTNRLSEDPSVTVLCIEAGIADQYEPIIQYPVYVGADIGGVYDWRLATVPQKQLDGATRPMPQGKALGGGSILNAMCWNRGGRDDYDAWEALGNPGWGWEGLLPYFIKSETYTPVSPEIARRYSINYDPAVHGRSGPVQVSYPNYFYPQSINLFAALNFLGVPTEYDANDGKSAGAAFVPTDLDPKNQTRSDARRAYFDPYSSRENFHVITGQHVTRVIADDVLGSFQTSNPTPGGNEDGNGRSSGNAEGFGFGPAGSNLLPGGSSAFRRREEGAGLRINGVEFAPNSSAPRQTVYATKEVIVAAGALHSAQLLQLSGFGPASLLQSFNIPVAIDLPGVGNNLQDHCLVGTFYPYNNDSYPSPAELTTNKTYNAEAEQEYRLYKKGPWTAGSPNALAFPPLSLISNKSADILRHAGDQSPETYLVSGLDPSLIAGYALQKESLTRRLAEKTVAAYEIINNNAGSLTVAVMHPFSRGTCSIGSPDPFEPPIIDPRWLSNPTDRQVLIEALLFNRRILAAPSMMELQAAQFRPSLNDDEAALNRIIDDGIRTEFHPSGTCAMLPLEQGGVVDSHLRVWGTQNLRVVDASIFPLVPAAHLQAVVYGVAEKAADIIKADNRGLSRSQLKASSEFDISRKTNSRLASSILSSNRSLETNVVLASPTASLSPGYKDFRTRTESPSTSIHYTTTIESVVGASSTILSTSSARRILPLASTPSISTVPPSAASDLSSSIIPTKDLDLARPIGATDSLPQPSLELDKTQFSSSIVQVFNSAGMPPPAINSLVPIILGIASPSTVNISSATPPTGASTVKQIQQHRAAIANFLRWLLSFFNTG